MAAPRTTRWASAISVFFSGCYGKALNTRYICRLMEKYERRSGVADVIPHVLRYTALTELVRWKKHDTALVAAYAGHAKLATTAISCAARHVGPGDRRELPHGGLNTPAAFVLFYP